MKTLIGLFLINQIATNNINSSSMVIKTKGKYCKTNQSQMGTYRYLIHDLCLIPALNGFRIVSLTDPIPVDV